MSYDYIVARNEGASLISLSSGNPIVSPAACAEVLLFPLLARVTGMLRLVRAFGPRLCLLPLVTLSCEENKIMKVVVLVCYN